MTDPPATPGPRPRAVVVYWVLCGASAGFFALYSTISAIYRIREAGLDPLELVLVGTVLEISAFAFEVPTGVVADLRSRRLSVILGTVLVGVGFLVEGTHPTFAWILGAQVIWGLGYTFISGAREAWIVDEVGGQGVGEILLRGSQAAQLGALVGIAGSVSLASVRLALPMVVGGILMIALGGGLSVLMPERNFPRGDPSARRRRSWKAMRLILVSGLATVRGRPALALILGAALMTGMSSEPLDRLWELHLLSGFELPGLGALDPIFWFGIINAGSLLLGAAGTELVRRRLDLDRPGVAPGTLVWLTGGTALCVAVFALSGSFWLGLAALWTGRVLRQVSSPVLSTWINRLIPSESRATLLSLRTQADSLGQVVGGPALGAIASGVSVRAALVGTALLLIPAQAFYRRARGSGS